MDRGSGTGVRTHRSLARRPSAWLVTLAAVALGQAVMWRGWYASDEWVTPGLGGVVLAAAAVAAPSLGVGAGALVLLTRRLGLAVFLASYLGLATAVGRSLTTSDSSTAVFAFAAPPVCSVPLLLVLAVVDRAADRRRRPRPPPERPRSPEPVDPDPSSGAEVQARPATATPPGRPVER